MTGAWAASQSLGVPVERHLSGVEINRRLRLPRPVLIGKAMQREERFAERAERVRLHPAQ